MSLRVLVTGGAGFVGTNLVALLTGKTDWEVTVLDNEVSASRRNLEPYPVAFLSGDVRDVEAVREAVSGQDVVVHLAADTRVMDSIDDPTLNFDVNAAGTLTLLEACRRANVGRVVAASTGGAILGDAQPPIHEDLPARPLSPYGASKLAMEGYLHAYGGAYGMQTAALRFANVYGPHSGHKGSVIAEFIRRMTAGEEITVFGDGTQTRDYVFVEDLVHGVLQVVENRSTGVFQLGTGTPTSINDLLKLLTDVVGSNASVRYEPARRGEVRDTWCDVGRAKRTFGFEPRTDLRAGLAATLAWFKEHSSHGQPVGADR